MFKPAPKATSQGHLHDGWQDERILVVFDPKNVQL